jgi:hypothetical protein
MKARVRRVEHEGVAYSDLTLDNVYTILGIEDDDYRLISDEGRPYLYPAVIFELVDSSEPSDWVTEFGAEGERYSYPPELSARGFFEAYFDGEPIAVATFRKHAARLFRGTLPDVARRTR